MTGAQFVLAKIEETAWDRRAHRTFKNWVLCKEWGLHDVKVLFLEKIK